MLSQVDSAQGNTEGELQLFKKIIKLKDSIIMQERKSIAEEMEAKYNNLKKDEIIELQNQNLKVSQEKNRFLKLLIIISVVLLIALSLLLYVYGKFHQKAKKIHLIEKEQMRKELESKEKELVAIALQVEQKTNIINKLYKQIKDYQKTNFDNNNNKLSNILSEIKTSFNLQKDIELFSNRFNELHHQFIHILRKNFPQLTSKEIKLLSFIKIGLSTKQIASIQNITASAVHKMRYRIKKKLQLEKDESLEDFISKL